MPNESYGEKLLAFWAPSGSAALWLALGLAPLFFFETFIHEGLHWLTGVANGDSPTLIPYAHFNARSGGNLNGVALDAGGFPATPQFVCFGFLLALIAVFIFTSPRWRWLRMFLTWWYLGLVLDLFYNIFRGLFGDARPGTDWAKFADGYGSGLAIFFAWLILLSILSQLGWIAVSRWHVNRPPGGGFFEFRVAAVFLAVLSLVAVIVSLTITHPDVIRNWWFWLVWTAQLLSFFWYVAYFVWATIRQS